MPCVPSSTFVADSVRVGDLAPATLARFGPAIATTRDTTEGADWLFPLIHYKYRDVELTVSEASGRVSTISLLSDALVTGGGLRLGMSRDQAESLLPAGVLHALEGPKGEKGWEADACGGGRATSMWLLFDGDGHLTRLDLNGFLPPTDDRGMGKPDSGTTRGPRYE
jgi:hypothetical protein